MKKTQKGFTLIELLIVIAIIGILAGVILVSTSSAKNKATAAATKQTLASLKQAMAVCCSSPSATLNAQAASSADPLTTDVCDNDGSGGGTTGIGTILPSATALKGTGTVTYTVVAQCDQTDPEIDVVLSAHPMTACQGSAFKLKLYGGMTAPSGC